MRLLLTLVLAVTALLRASAALAQLPARSALLDVPYVAQTEALCGGAAAAMVLRYWGARDVQATDFAPLVRVGERGIRTSDLTAETRARGWIALPATPAIEDGAAILRTHVDRGRPVIALIEDRPGVFHYVVVVAIAGTQVVAHDPARRPFLALDWAEFDRRWASADRWMLVVVPRAAAPAPALSEGMAPAVVSSPDEIAPAASTAHRPCAQLIGASIARAREGDDRGAEHGLSAATHLCPHDAAAWRELAGLRFKERRWPEAAALAARALRLAPGDAHATELAAAAAFLAGDHPAALDAWNRLGQPRIDRIVVDGAHRTRHPLIVAAIGLRPRTLLTSARLAQADRRLAQLPAASRTVLRYRPRDDGMADLEAAIVERSLMPRGWGGWTGVGVHAIVADEAQLDVAGAAGMGELWSAGYRWTAARPRVSAAVALPAPGALPGVLTIDGRWERQSYRLRDNAAGMLVRETERRVGAGLADWLTPNLRWHAGGAVHRFDGAAFAAAQAGVDLRAFSDRVSLQSDAGVWWPRAARGSFGRFNARAAWTSTTASESGPRHRWSATALYGAATSRAPLALWPGAGTGKGRDALLRAHPLLDEDVVTGDVFGRRLLSGTVEYERRTWSHPLATAGVAAFVDLARAWDRPFAEGPSRLHADVGAGIRLRAPAIGGVVRIDVARGLRDGRAALSVGYVVRAAHRQSAIGNR